MNYVGLNKFTAALTVIERDKCDDVDDQKMSMLTARMLDTDKDLVFGFMDG